MDPTDTPAWRGFIADLRSKGIDFSTIQFADDLSRAEVIAAAPGLNAIERAMVSSTWARLAAPQNRLQTSPQSMGASLFSPPNNNSFGGGNRATVSAADPSMSFGSPPRSFSGGVACDPTSLRAALARGDSTVALPLASELLQHDPASLCLVLHEHLPHMSVDQIRAVLGLGAPTVSGAAANASAQVLNNAPPGASLLNGKPIQPGVVLTAQSLAAQFGSGFTATSNGLYLTFPYTVQRGDRITVRPVSDRTL